MKFVGKKAISLQVLGLPQNLQDQLNNSVIATLREQEKIADALRLKKE